MTKHAATAAATDTQSTARKSLSAPVHKRPYDSLRSENQYQIRRVVVPRAVVYRGARSAWPKLGPRRSGDNARLSDALRSTPTVASGWTLAAVR